MRTSKSRRELLQATALLPNALVAAVAAPARFFTPAELEISRELTETILPADKHSGGAKAARVAEYIDGALHDSVDDKDRSLWREGLRLVDEMSRRHCGKLFVKASSAERVKVLEAASTRPKDSTEARFFQELKRLTVFGYYTSRTGIFDEMKYKGNRIHKEFSGCETD